MGSVSLSNDAEAIKVRDNTRFEAYVYSRIQKYIYIRLHIYVHALSLSLSLSHTHTHTHTHTHRGVHCHQMTLRQLRYKATRVLKRK